MQSWKQKRMNDSEPDAVEEAALAVLESALDHIFSSSQLAAAA
jgi:hypothetical protein